MHVLHKVLAILLIAVFGLGMVAEAQWSWTPQTGRFINLKKLPKETPELQLEYARGLLLAGETKKAWRETQKFEEFYGDTEYADENQFLRGEIKLAEGDLDDAADEFQKVLVNYPDTSLYNQAIEKQYEVGDKYFALAQEKMQKRWVLRKKRPLKKAIAVYSMVVDNQPFTPAAAQAQYKIGLCEYTREHYGEAAYEYRRVIEDYAGSDWVDDATYGLAICYYDSALPPEYDQSPSALAIDTIDIFMARFPTDIRGGELQEKRRDMRENLAQQRLLNAKFYERRRNFGSAKICYEIVTGEYPETNAAQLAQAWLDEHQMIAHVGTKKQHRNGGVQ